MNASRTRRLAVLVLTATLAPLAGACSDDGEPSLGSTETTAVTSGSFDPALPAGVNPLPYTYDAMVGLGTWKMRVTDVSDGGDGNVALEVWVQNGSNDPQSLQAEAFLMYDDRNRGVAPSAGDDAFTDVLASGAEATVSIPFSLASDARPRALLFRGSAVYGERTLDGFFSLDPEFDPDSPD